MESLLPVAAQARLERNLGLERESIVGELGTEEIRQRNDARETHPVLLPRLKMM
jgi:hypothetical protein